MITGFDPTIICTEHLVMEHGEIHLFRTACSMGIPYHGGMDSARIVRHHDAVARELGVRDLKHGTVLEPFNAPRTDRNMWTIFGDLAEDCELCRARLMLAGLFTIEYQKVRDKDVYDERCFPSSMEAVAHANRRRRLGVHLYGPMTLDTLKGFRERIFIFKKSECEHRAWLLGH